MLSFIEFLCEWDEPGTIKFHKDIAGFPSSMPRPRAGMRLRWGPHSMKGLWDDNIEVGPPMLPADFKVIEATYVYKRFKKWLVRFQYDQYRDLVLSISPEGFVITSWVNGRNDFHRTLNRSAYTSPKAAGIL